MAIPPPTLRQLRSLIAAVETGSVSAAARALHISQPAASQQLRELEHALAVRLLERGSGTTRPTAAGAAVLVHARRVQVALDDLVAAAAAFQGGETGRVRLGTGATACIHLLPPLLARMKARMPGLEIIIATGNTPDMLRKVQDGALDVALVTQLGRLDRSLETRQVHQEAMLAYAPATLLPEAAALRPAALSRQPLILYESGGTTRGVVDAWFRRAGQTPRPIMELGSVEAIKLLAESGLGATILPASAIVAPPPDMAVRALRPALTRCLAVVLRRDKLLDLGLRVCLEELGTLQAG
ncbi:MAG TPA: LysR family transcriptional regulator [Acetobacteraceae bacterium]|jgi:DNA-binding transcriptional LysR family regulator